MAKKEDEGTKLAKVLWYYNLYNKGQLKQKIVCPFHQDANPSLLADLAEGSWHCFGCGLGGNAIQFVQKMEKKYHGLNDLQALKKYRNILKSDKCSDIHITAAMRKTAPRKSELYAEAYDYYHGLKTIDWLEDDIDEVVEVRDYMEQRGFTPEVLNQVRCKVTYQWSYAMVFPIMDNGKFKGWVSRTTKKQIEEKRKYLYNAGFSRATTCCGDYGDEDYVFVVEGYMDRLRFVQFGIKNVVALLGWKMSDQQEQKLKAAGVTKIISALDNDPCGKRGTEYLKTVAGFEVTRWCYLKGIKDPGEMDEKQFKKMYQKTMYKFKGGN